jgi:hypothetical protein
MEKYKYVKQYHKITYNKTTKCPARDTFEMARPLAENRKGRLPADEIKIFGTGAANQVQDALQQRDRHHHQPAEQHERLRRKHRELQLPGLSTIVRKIRPDGHKQKFRNVPIYFSGKRNFLHDDVIERIMIVSA